MKCDNTECGYDHAQVCFRKNGRTICLACAVAEIGGYEVIREALTLASPYPPKSVKSLAEKREQVRKVFERMFVNKKLGDKYILTNGDSAGLGTILTAAGENVSEAERIIANAFKDAFLVEKRIISPCEIAKRINRYTGTAKPGNRTDAQFKR